MPAQPQLLIAMAVYTALLLLLFRLPVFAFLNKAAKGRDAHLDGLRFFAAIMVIVLHVGCSFNWFNDRGWVPGQSTVTNKIGAFGVGLFFMLSAYLLSSLNLEGKGALGRYVCQRVFRIVPMALFSCAACLIVLRFYGGPFDEQEASRKIFAWLNAGIFDSKPDMNSIKPAWVVNAGVMWTLHWEWCLYSFIPVVIFLERLIALWVIAIFIIFVGQFGFLLNDRSNFCVSCFGLGFMARSRLVGRISAKSSGAVIALLACTIAITRASNYSPLSTLMTFIFFVFCHTDHSLRNFLSQKGAVRLGKISYSLYLLHGLSLFIFNEISAPASFSIFYVGKLLAMLILMAMCAALTQSAIRRSRKITTGIKE